MDPTSPRTLSRRSGARTAIAMKNVNGIMTSAAADVGERASSTNRWPAGAIAIQPIGDARNESGARYEARLSSATANAAPIATYSDRFSPDRATHAAHHSTTSADAMPFIHA